MGRMRARPASRRVPLVLAVVAAWCWLLVAPAAATTSPDITIAKVSDAAGPLKVGDAFTYTLTVGNTGTAAAHDIEVQDDLPLGVRVTTILPDFPGGQCTVASSAGTGHPEHWSVTCTRSALAAGASVSATFGVKLTGDVRCGSLTNTATVAASDEPAGAQGNDEASVTDPVTCPPSIDITKSAPRFTHVGSRVPLTMQVTNAGDVALDHVTVTDPGCDGAPHGNGDGTLSPGERWTYHCDHVIRADAPGWFATTATVRAASSGGSAHASARSATRVLRPKLTISVVPDPSSGSPGDAVTYRYVVRNTGDTTLTDLTVTDDRLGAVGTVSQLAPGHGVSLSMTRALSATHVWVTNTGTVTGHDPSGHPVSASDQASVTIVAPATHPGGSSGSGDGTAFTGGDARLPGIAAVVLAMVGAGSLLAAARRRSSLP
jgi:uncharacterized repeat protein (TIGR01451 family)